MDFIRSVISQDVTESDGVATYDLPVNPLSHIVLTTKVLNAGANTKATLAQILGAIEKVEVLHEGSAILSLNGADLYALNCILLGHEPWQENVVNTDNAVRHLTMMIPFGRRLYDPRECLFPTTKGELQLQITWDVADTGYDGLISQIETVELMGASPERFLKATTLNLTPTSGADNDLDLPIGNTLMGVLLWGTTVPTGTSWTTTIDKVRLLANNKEIYYANCNWESLHGDFINRLSPANAWAEKFHMENTASAYTQNADTAAEEQDDTSLANYAFLDLDPRGDDQFLFDTAGLSSLKLRITAGDGNALRAIPLYLVDTAKYA